MTTDINKILLFKTNIGTDGDVHVLQPVLDQHPGIEKWSIDLDDDDRILRITSATLNHSSIIDMVRYNGYHCEELCD